VFGVRVVCFLYTLTMDPSAPPSLILIPEEGLAGGR
jgi:hypothetical protein